MLTTRQPIFRKHWHAVMPLAHLAEGPQPFTLLGENIVLFLDERGEPAALKDRCCHRTARLSKGRCVDGRLECGYHGWTYDRGGRVVKIPQYADDKPIPADYCTPAYSCTARYGYAWVALDEPIADIPEVPEFGARGWRTIFQFHEVWHTSPMRALENSFDNSHFSFVHRATFGVAEQPRPSKYELVENASGFYAETVIPAANPERYQRISGVTDPVTTRHMRNAYFMPFSRRLDIEYPSGIRHIIINCFTPIDDGRIQLCQWLFRNDTEDDCPAQMLIDFDAEITREDKDILESTDPDAVIDTRRRGVEYSMESDRPGMLIRKKLMEHLARHGEREIHRGNADQSAVIPIQAVA
ncbi:aromatic ring-hydroxylating dioxygenase subunit alpha [Rhizobacter sp. J219]|uniref:aromatic ring-hydroxylating dioxygenase subunit alpha n=1 Tax=Rhizobacter sp. J219 TaxID=2898430 RepID=UPI0021508524|nr:aromatic ring-hydroxylating dioxygenase subunit alpha [Rhizobacter sp. J219]MCR5885085.1 aromatic ring-hydroxylating dioxygenase subunit alpha [Rhizobacter sp. J219]